MPVRIKKEHSQNLHSESEPVDAEQLFASQSIAGAALAAVGSVILLSLFWLETSVLFGRVFPWIAILQGIAVGFSIRRWGHGYDWRFPTVAAVAAYFGAYLGNFVIAAYMAGEELNVSSIQVIFSMSQYTLTTYFSEVVTFVDHTYAVYGAVLAGYFSRRPLNRAEVYALRTYDKDS